MSPFAALLAKITRLLVSLMPWSAALYLHYWLEHGGIWEVDRPYRALISALLLAIGMGASFLLHSYLARRAAVRSA